MTRGVGIDRLAVAVAGVELSQRAPLFGDTGCKVAGDELAGGKSVAGGANCICGAVVVGAWKLAGG